LSKENGKKSKLDFEVVSKIEVENCWLTAELAWVGGWELNLF
jgi:hypothetical protein